MLLSDALVGVRVIFVSFGCYTIRGGWAIFGAILRWGIFIPIRIVRSGSVALMVILWVGCLCKYVVVVLCEYWGLARLCSLLLLATLQNIGDRGFEGRPFVSLNFTIIQPLLVHDDN